MEFKGKYKNVNNIIEQELPIYQVMGQGMIKKSEEIIKLTNT